MKNDNRLLLVSLTLRKYLPLLLAAAALIGFQPAPAAAEAAVKTLTVMAAGHIRTDNIETARNQAISAGLDTAVGMVVVAAIPPETMLRYFQPITRLVNTHRDKFIQDYKVLTESRSGQQYNVLIQATISLDSLEQQLTTAGVLFGRKALPKILLVVAEKSRSDLPPRYWWGQNVVGEKGLAEQDAAEALKERGFTVIEPVIPDTLRGSAADLNKPDLTDREAIELGRLFQADVVVIGRSNVHLLPNSMGSVKSYQGIVTVRAVRLDTGEKIAASTQTAVAAEADAPAGAKQALSKAGARAGADLASQIQKIWHRQLNQPTLVELVIQGSGHLQNFEKFRQALMELSGLREFQIREMRPDQTTLTVNFEGNADQLAAALMLNAYGSFGIDILEVSSSRLSIKLIPK